MSETPAKSVDLRDLNRLGWFNGNEIYPGFPISADDVVLDAGCGDGGYSLFAGRLGAHVIFSDILPEKMAKVEAALRQTPAREVTPIRTESQLFPLPDATVTRVICTEVLEHVEDPKLFFSELVRVAKPGALFVISVPHPASEAIQKVVAPPQYFQPPNHVRVFTEEAIAQLARDAGLIVERHDVSGFYGAIRLTLFWMSYANLVTDKDPVLKAWDETWRLILDNKDKAQFISRLDQALPSSQILIARKP